jgi:hypothetical protein
VPLFLLWVNLHALVLVGLAILAVTVICDALQDRFDARVRLLAVVAVLCAVATCINPYGVNYWSAADQLRPGNMAAFIEEWQSPLYSDALIPAMWSYVVFEFLLVRQPSAHGEANPYRAGASWPGLLLLSALFLQAAASFVDSRPIVALAVLAANARYLDTQAMWTWWRKTTKQPQLLGIPTGLRALRRRVLCSVSCCGSRRPHSRSGATCFRRARRPRCTRRRSAS